MICTFFCPLHTSHGVILEVYLELLPNFSNFLTESPYFSLNATTKEGPPTSFSWIRNELVLDGEQNGINISIEAIPNGPEANFRYRDSIYQSTLGVTGVMPGEYIYIANNEFSTPVMASITIQGN